MKKSLAILLALALVFSSITVAFAEETLPADAKSVTDLGMLVGSGNGVTTAYLAETPSRIQAAVMFLRLKGLEDEAKAFTGTDNFADAANAAWAAPIMAYLKANPELGWIGNAGNFDPTANMDAKSYYKVMLETLGYKQNTAAVIGEFTWDNLVEFAATKGLSKVATVTNFTVNDLATATIEALKATVKGSEKTLAAQLVDAEVITVEAAVAAGVYTVAPTVLAVESVKSTNLKETVVTFNKEVDEDSAEKVGNYSLDDDDIEGTVSLNDDKKSVTITWNEDNELDNQTEYDLTVDDVLDVDGGALEEVTVTFLANDVATPVAQSLTLVGPNKLKLVFSEPIFGEDASDSDYVEDNYSVVIEDEDFDYEVALITIDGNEATIELSDDELEEGDYSVEVKGFEDYAGLKNLKKEFTLAYAKDTTLPVATVTEATQTKVVVEFNKPVYNGEAGEGQPLTTDFFYHTYSSYNPVFVKVADDNETFTLYFTEAAANAAGILDGELTGEADRPLAEGAVKFVVVANGDDNITDEWGNELEDNISFNLSISSDVTAPTVTEIEVDAQDTIFVYFSEDVLDDDGTSNVGTSNFTVVDEDGEDVDIDYVTYHSDDDDEEYYAEIVFEEDLEGEYSITVENVIDTALEENEISKVTKKFEVVDETAPTLTKIEAIGINGDIEYDEDEEEWVETDDDEVDYIYVTFPEDMATSGAYSVLDKDNYQIFDGTDYIDLGDDDKIVTFQGNDKVKITLDDATLYDVEAGLGEDNDGTGIKLVVGRVADALGNKVSSFNVAVDVTAETSLGITAVETVDEKTIVITIDGELKAVNKSYIKVQHDENGDGDFTDANEVAKALYAIKSWEINDDNDTEITAILPSAYYLYSSSDVALRLTLEADELETVSGTSISSDPFTDIEDGYAPSITDEDDIVRVGAEGSMRFSINFDEELATGDVLALYAQDLVVKNSDGDVLVAGVDYVVVGLEDYDYEADLDGDGTKEDHVMTNGKLVIEIQETSNGKEEGNFKVYSNATIKYIQDVEGNKAEAFTDSVTIEDLYVAPEV